LQNRQESGANNTAEAKGSEAVTTCAQIVPEHPRKVTFQSSTGTTGRQVA
jgi:hypothetical protein